MLSIAKALPDAFAWNSVGNLYKIGNKKSALFDGER